MLSILLFIFACGISYLAGSICSAVIISKLFGLPDPRSEGSQNPGATNVLRLAGKKYAAMVLVLDMLKGFLPVFFAKLCGADAHLLGYMCLAAVLGHIYPVFFDFQGGKGVATAIGAMLGLNVTFGLFIVLVWLLMVKYSRYSSASSITAMAIAPLFVLLTSTSNAFLPILIIAIVVIMKHKDNIIRLKNGQESPVEFN